MDDQASRWKAFEALERWRDARNCRDQEAVLLNAGTGGRYVRTQWFTEYLRGRSNPGETAALMTELERLGSSKAGSEGRIKATEPGFGRTSQWAFLIVPNGWEDQ
jgi:hypothetical protein